MGKDWNNNMKHFSILQENVDSSVQDELLSNQKPHLIPHKCGMTTMNFVPKSTNPSFYMSINEEALPKLTPRTTFIAICSPQTLSPSATTPHI